MVTQAIYPDVVGGAPIAIHELATALVAAGVDVEVHSIDYGEAPVAEPLYRLTRHHRVRGPWDWIGTKGNPIPRGLAHAVATSDADIVHVHSHLFFPSIFAARAAQKAGIPYVVTVHGVRAARGAIVNGLQEIWIRTAARRLFRNAHRVLCLNQADATEVVRYGAPAAHVDLVHNPIRIDMFRPADGRKLQVIWNGRHVAEKDVPTLLRAWARAAPQLKGHELWLIGEGPLKKQCETLALELGIASSTKFYPFMDQPRLAKAMQESALFVFPSLREGQPLSLLEAMACGLPVVTTDGLGAFVKHGGITVPAEDPVALAEAIVTLLSDPNARRKGLAGSAWVHENFAPSAVAAQTIQVYHKILGVP